MDEVMEHWEIILHFKALAKYLKLAYKFYR